MFVYDPDRKCAYCGDKDTAFFAQEQRKTQFTISNKCFRCKRKSRSEYYYEQEKYQRYLKWKK